MFCCQQSPEMKETSETHRSSALLLQIQICSIPLQSCFRPLWRAAWTIILYSCDVSVGSFSYIMISNFRTFALYSFRTLISTSNCSDCSQVSFLHSCDVFVRCYWYMISNYASQFLHSNLALLKTQTAQKSQLKISALMWDLHFREELSKVVSTIGVGNKIWEVGVKNWSFRIRELNAYVFNVESMRKRGNEKQMLVISQFSALKARVYALWNGSRLLVRGTSSTKCHTMAM